VECVYEVKLRWGGRAFNQSRFGACISDTKASTDKVKKLRKLVVVSGSDRPYGLTLYRKCGQKLYLHGE
jgi:hypothetical protein